MKFEFSVSFRKMLKYPISWNYSSGSRVAPFGRMDRYDETNNPFSQFCKGVFKKEPTWLPEVLNGKTKIYLRYTSKLYKITQIVWQVGYRLEEWTFVVRLPAVLETCVFSKHSLPCLGFTPPSIQQYKSSFLGIKRPEVDRNFTSSRVMSWGVGYRSG